MLTMFMPAYNEQAVIRTNAVVAVRRLAEVSATLAVPIRLVILDDGSTDATADEVVTAMTDEPSIRYLHVPGPSRRECLAQAMINADTPYVGWMDADLATSLDQLEDLVRGLDRYDIVTGSRYLASSRARRTMKRRAISRTYNRAVQVMFGSRIRDHWCGFKVFRRAALQEIVAHIGTDVADRQMFWDAQMWVCAQRLGLRILEVPVDWCEGDKSALALHTELPMVGFTLRYWVSGRWRDVVATPEATPFDAAPVSAPPVVYTDIDAVGARR